MANYRLPIDSDCYATWEFDNQSDDLSYAEVVIMQSGAEVIRETTLDDNLEILASPKRLRLRVRRGQVTKAGAASVNIRAVDQHGNNAVRRAEPSQIMFWK